MRRMVTILRKLFMDQLKFHLISEPGKKMESNGINESYGANNRQMKCCGVSCTSKKRHQAKTIWKHMNYGQRQEFNDH
jgi:hypothetical protein